MQVVVTWGLRADGPAQVLQTHLPVWAEPGGSRNNPPVQGEGLGQLPARGRGGERGGESSLPPGGNGVGPAPCPREVRYQDALFLRPPAPPRALSTSSPSCRIRTGARGPGRWERLGPPAGAQWTLKQPSSGRWALCSTAGVTLPRAASWPRLRQPGPPSSPGVGT